MIAYRALVHDLESGLSREETWDLFPSSRFRFLVSKEPGRVPWVRGVPLVPRGAELARMRRVCAANPKMAWLAATFSEVFDMEGQFLRYTIHHVLSPREGTQHVEQMKSFEMSRQNGVVMINGKRAFHQMPTAEELEELREKNLDQFLTEVRIVDATEVNLYLKEWL